MRDVARKIGVSVSAVSLALKNSPKISPERRSEIISQAEEMGYRRDPRVTELMAHLRAPRSRRTASKIAIIVPELTRKLLADYPPIQGLLAGAEQIAAVAGFGIDTFYPDDPGMSLRRVRSIILARGIKGVIIAPCRSGVARLDFDCSDLCVATAGYSIEEPRISRACPNYLQMMDELIATCVAKKYKRIGLVMTYNEGGIGHKLFTSSFLFYQSKIPPESRIPILAKSMISKESVSDWFAAYRPDVIISAGSVYEILRSIKLRVPQDVAFASIDVSEPPVDAFGANHRYDLVGHEALKQVLTLLNLNATGVPEHPKVVLVDSHYQDGFTLRKDDGTYRRRRPTPSKRPTIPSFRGFLD